MPRYKITREFTGLEVAFIDADSEDHALDLVGELWNDLDPETTEIYNYTGNDEVELVEE